jgi:hypothetical protein
MDMNAIGTKFPLSTFSLKDTAKMLAREEAEPRVNDAVVKGEKDDPGLMPRILASRGFPGESRQ